MKPSGPFFAITSFLFSFSALAQVSGESSELAYSSLYRPKNHVDRVLDAEYNSRKEIYQSLNKEPRADSVFKVDMKSKSLESIEREIEERFKNQKEVPDRFAILISGAARDYDRNKIIEIVRKAAEKRKRKVESEILMKSQSPNGKLVAGSQGKIDSEGSDKLKGGFSITAGLGGGGKIGLRWRKQW